MMSRPSPRRTATARTALALRLIGVTVLIGIVMALLGPFGSYMNGSAVQRAAYWIASMLLGLLVYGAAFRIATMLSPPGSRLWWPTLIGATLLASVPQAMATRAGAFWLWPQLTRLYLPWTLWFAQVTTIGLIAMLGAGFLLLRSARAAKAAGPAPLDIGSFGKEVLALQMEDHYVRVHRPNGSELLMMPLGQAIERTASKGLRTHRSWWVATDAVVRVEGDARSMRLHLSNGIIAPVSRSAIIHLKAAGWIG